MKKFSEGAPGHDASWRFFFLLLFLLLIQGTGILHFGSLKAGTHIDEVFTMELANHPSAFYDTKKLIGTWTSGRFWHEALSAQRGRLFDYAIPYENQTSDVHPPLYYFVVHTAASLAPDSASYWIGIAPNVVFCLLTTLTMYFASLELSEGKWLALLAAASWALGAGAMSSAVFMRMYALLALLCQLQLLLHLKARRQAASGRFSRKTLFLFWLVTLLGILTQYYFTILCFFVCGFFFLRLLANKQWKLLCQYAAVEIGAVLTAAAVFPAMIEQIFFSYRGAENFEKFLNSSAYADHLRTVLGFVNAAALGGWGAWILAAAGAFFLLGVCLRRSRPAAAGRGQGVTLAALSMTTLGYVLLVARIAPYQQDRYYMCIYPFVTLAALHLLHRAAARCLPGGKYLNAGFAVFCLLMVAAGHQKAGVNYLHRELAERPQQLGPYLQYPVVVLNGHAYDRSPDSWLYELRRFPAVFRCPARDLSGLRTAMESGDLSRGFVLYLHINYWQFSDEQLLAALRKEAPVDSLRKIASAGCDVYFCTLRSGVPQSGAENPSRQSDAVSLEND